MLALVEQFEAACALPVLDSRELGHSASRPSYTSFQLVHSCGRFKGCTVRKNRQGIGVYREVAILRCNVAPVEGLIVSSAIFWRVGS
jgi:hypothetical protein